MANKDLLDDPLTAGPLKKYAMEQFHEMRHADAARAVAAGARGVDIATFAAAAVIAARVHLESLLAFCEAEGEAEFGARANQFGADLAALAMPGLMEEYRRLSKSGQAEPPATTPKTELPN